MTKNPKGTHATSVASKATKVRDTLASGTEPLDSANKAKNGYNYNIGGPGQLSDETAAINQPILEDEPHRSASLGLSPMKIPHYPEQPSCDSIMNWVTAGQGFPMTDYQLLAANKIQTGDHQQRPPLEPESGRTELSEALEVDQQRKKLLRKLEGTKRVINLSATGLKYRAQRVRTQDLVSQISPGTLAISAIRTVRDLEAVEHEMLENGLKVLLFPLNNYVNKRKYRSLDDSKPWFSRITQAIASRARPFWLQPSVFEAVAHDRKNINSDRVETTFEKWMTTGEEDKPNSVGKTLSFGKDATGALKLTTRPHFYPHDLVLEKGATQSRRSVNLSESHPSTTQKGTRNSFITAEQVEEFQLEYPGASHLIFISPQNEAYKTIRRAEHRIQFDDPNYDRKIQQCKADAFQYEIREGDRILTQLDEYRGLLKNSRFYQGTLDHWLPTIENATPEGTAFTYIGTQDDSLSTATSGTHCCDPTKPYVLRISAFNKIDLLTTATPDTSLGVKLIGGFDAACRATEESIIKQILGPIQQTLVTSEDPEWLGNKVRTNAQVEDQETQVTLPVALSVDIGSATRPRMTQLDPEKLVGWNREPRTRFGNEANLLRLQSEVLNRTVANLSVSLGNSVDCCEVLQLVASQVNRALLARLDNLDRAEKNERSRPAVWTPIRLETDHVHN